MVLILFDGFTRISELFVTSVSLTVLTYLNQFGMIQCISRVFAVKIYQHFSCIILKKIIDYIPIECII